MAKKRKIEHFWISNAVADKFIAWCRKYKELTELPAMTSEFTPERARFQYIDPKYGFTFTFMLYNNLKYDCVNVPVNTRTVFSKFAEDTGLEMPSGSLGTARGDGKDDATKTAEREAKAAEKKASAAKKKEESMLAKAEKDIKAKSAKPKVTKAKAKVKKSA